MSEYGNGEFSHENEKDNNKENEFEPKNENFNNKGFYNNFEPIFEEKIEFFSEKFEPLTEKNLKDEDLQLKSSRKLLYDNPIKNERVCGKCHQIKPYNEFKNRSDNRKKKNHYRPCLRGC